MKYFTYEDVCAINELVCGDDSKESIIINKNNIESALSVQNSYYENEEEIRAALFHHLIIAHGFQDGNKRTAVLTLLYNGPVNVNTEQLEHIAKEIASSGSSNMNIKTLAEKLFKVNTLSEHLNNDQLKAIRVIKHKYPYTNITVANKSNNTTRIVIDCKEFNVNTAIEKMNAIVHDIEMLIGLNYKIRYEKPLQQTDLNYPGYHLFRLVVSLEPYPENPVLDDIAYNSKTGYWELNGMEFENYEDALQFID